VRIPGLRDCIKLYFYIGMKAGRGQPSIPNPLAWNSPPGFEKLITKSTLSD
jgi:hypothetical protein